MCRNTDTTSWPTTRNAEAMVAVRPPAQLACSSTTTTPWWTKVRPGWSWTSSSAAHSRNAPMPWRAPSGPETSTSSLETWSRLSTSPLFSASCQARTVEISVVYFSASRTSPTVVPTTGLPVQNRAP